MKTRLANLEKYPGTADAELEETYWRLIQETREQLKTVENQPPEPKTTQADVEKVTAFLDNLETNWERHALYVVSETETV